MLESEILQAILDSIVDPIVFADNDHVIRYVNPEAEKKYAERDWHDLVGRSLMDCHNAASCDRILRIHAEFLAGAEEAFVSEDEKQRIIARAVRGSNGELLGYYERYENVP